VDVINPLFSSIVDGSFVELEEEVPEEEDGDGADGRGVDDRNGEDEGVEVGDEEDRGDRWNGRIRL